MMVSESMPPTSESLPLIGNHTRFVPLNSSNLLLVWDYVKMCAKRHCTSAVLWTMIRVLLKKLWWLWGLRFDLEESLWCGFVPYRPTCAVCFSNVLRNNDFSGGPGHSRPSIDPQHASPWNARSKGPAVSQNLRARLHGTLPVRPHRRHLWPVSATSRRHPRRGRLHPALHANVHRKYQSHQVRKEGRIR